MANWVAPKESRKQVSKAGTRIGRNEETFDDIIALERWRASHAYVINTFQESLLRLTFRSHLADTIDFFRLIDDALT